MPIDGLRRSATTPQLVKSPASGCLPVAEQLRIRALSQIGSPLLSYVVANSFCISSNVRPLVSG
jgi:hypothetical protein